MSERSRTPIVIALVVLLITGLPLAVFFDLRDIADNSLSRQAGDLNSVVSAIRSYYANNVVNRVLAAHGTHTAVTEKYESIPGAIPIPATMSLELGQVVADQHANVSYRFVSDFPFKHRAAHPLDDFERTSLAALRAQPNQHIVNYRSQGLSDQVRFIVPVVMGSTCVSCHNTHPDSPKRDWKVGDVRGIQEVSITQPIATGVFSFKFLLIYFAFAGLCGVGFIMLQHRQAVTIRNVNRELASANSFLDDVSKKIARYISPQIFSAIFSGRSDVQIHTERKKLTIFFSDIKDFTSTTERLQPEELTALLNEYFTEMTNIALVYGGTVDKFIGDALLVFFGDPESNGVVEDARACVRMAMAMQQRLRELNVIWRGRGIEKPFEVRMGINTGFCNVGNFGSTERMDYTIIGAEANLAARLQQTAAAGGVVLSYETYALVRDIVSAHPLAAITMKGISREVIPYAVDGTLEIDVAPSYFAERAEGVELYVDLAKLDDDARKHAREVLRRALDALEKS